MTDAALAVTQSAVEHFTEHYLQTLGCTIDKDGDTWEVTVPDAADTGLSAGSLSLRCEDDAGDTADGEWLHPESEFFQRILREAGERCPTGTLSIETDRAEVQVPKWLDEGGVDVRDVRFTPYYDRTAVVVLFNVSVETVSTYQQEFLRAIAIDSRSEECLPALEATFLRLTSVASDSVATSPQSSLTESAARSLLETAREELVSRVQPDIDEIHDEASRAADAEIEEYRQMQQQRLQELEEQRSALSSKIDELSEVMNHGDQDERVEALKERKELKQEREEIEAELANLQERREQGFPERQREIRDRHALDVRVRPLTMTQVDYERGEVDIELVEGDVTRTVTVGYGSGVGLTEPIRCSSCSQEFTEENPLQRIENGMECESCSTYSP